MESGDYVIQGNHQGAMNFGPDPSCSLQGADVSSSTSDSVTVSLPKVDILLNGNVITDTTQNVVVGQQISLSAQVTNGTPSNPQWTIPGTRVANYVVDYTNQTSATNAVVTEITNQNLIQPSISFYWVDGAEARQVQYSVKINNKFYTATVTLNVKRPTARLTTKTGTVGLGITEISENGDTAFSLHYGEIFGTPGISFSATATLPNNFSGDIIWVQVVNSRRTRTPEEGSQQVLEGVGLDTEFPLGEPNTGEESDSPQQPVIPFCSYKSVSAVDSFTTWLMFKPKGIAGVSIYVPLRKVDWSWSGTGTRNGSRCSASTTWTLAPPSNTKNPSSEYTTDFPQWIANIKQFDFH